MRKIKSDVINAFSLLTNNKLSVVSALLNTVVFHVFLLQVKCRVLRLVVKVKNDLLGCKTWLISCQLASYAHVLSAP